jgi:cyclic-di-GMP-binding protein
MTFPLPPTASDHPPVFLSTLACQDWLAGVPLANSGEAQVMLLRQLNLLNGYSIAALDRLQLLETLRPIVIDVQDDMARKFACKPLPLNPSEQAALDGTIALWSALLNGYLRLINLAQSDNSLHLERARITQRALAVLCDWQVDLCRGALLPPPSYWQMLHRLLATGERMGVLGTSIDDACRHGSTLTCPLAAYSEAVLLHTSNAFELVPRQLNWVARWSRRWGAKLALLTDPPSTGSSALALCVDLSTDRPPRHFIKDAQDGRWLDTSALRKSLKSRLALLAQGEQPSRLSMGEDCTQPAAGLLLARVYQRWCKGGSPRRQERRTTSGSSGNCDFIVSLNAAHYYLSDRQPFRPPVADENMLRREREALATFGNAQHKAENYSTQHGFDIEHWTLTDDWQVLDESANGLRLTRPLRDGVRVGSGNLVAVKISSTGFFVLGAVRWALQTPGQPGTTLSIGVELFPGVAQPVAVRGADPGTRENFRQGLLLPAVAALISPESLIVPYGTYRLGRPVDVWTDAGTQRFTLDHVLDRTQEFERCTFTRS